MNIKNKNITRLVFGGLLAAIVTVSTMVIQIPTPTKGYVNLGDCFVIIAGWLLGGWGGALAAGIGSGLADLFAGYATYAPATFVIKALMAAAAAGTFRLITKKNSSWSFGARIIAAVTAELIMIVGYAVFEAFLYGSAGTALVGVPANAVQGLAGIIFSVTVHETVIKRIPAAKSLNAAD